MLNEEEYIVTVENVVRNNACRRTVPYNYCANCIWEECCDHPNKNTLNFEMITEPTNIIKTALYDDCEPNSEIKGSIFHSNDLNLSIMDLEFYASNLLQLFVAYDAEELHLYVKEGCPPMLIAVVNACKRVDINLVLYHYNSLSKTYESQLVE